MLIDIIQLGSNMKVLQIGSSLNPFFWLVMHARRFSISVLQFGWMEPGHPLLALLVLPLPDEVFYEVIIL
jgi:hypothetical protein